MRRQALIERLKGHAEIVWEVMTPASETISDEIKRKFSSLDVTAVVCSHDLIAIGLLRALWEMGISVPGEVSVVGYDDVQWSAVVSPGLTTIRQPFAELAERAVEFLLDRIETPGRRARRWAADVTLVQRETVADLRQRRGQRAGPPRSRERSSLA